MPPAAYLGSQGGDDALGMHQRRVAKVIEAAVAEDLGTSLEPHGLAEAHTVLRQQLGGQAAQGAQHGPAGVDDLDLAVASKGLGVGRQAGGVPPVVSRVLTSQVLRDRREIAQELGAVGAILCWEVLMSSWLWMPTTARVCDMRRTNSTAARVTWRLPCGDGMYNRSRGVEWIWITQCKYVKELVLSASNMTITSVPTATRCSHACILLCHTLPCEGH